jgi:hypothetical protein
MMILLPTGCPVMAFRTCISQSADLGCHSDASSCSCTLGLHAGVEFQQTDRNVGNLRPGWEVNTWKSVQQKCAQISSEISRDVRYLPMIRSWQEL